MFTVSSLATARSGFSATNSRASTLATTARAPSPAQVAKRSTLWQPGREPRRKIGHIAQPAMEYLPAGGDTDAEPPWNQHPSAATIAATGGSTNRNRNRDENQRQQHPSHTRHTHTTRRHHRGMSERHLTERRRHTRRRPGVAIGVLVGVRLIAWVRPMTW
jgi:hypothetical protein